MKRKRQAAALKTFLSQARALESLKNEKGAALIATYLISAIILVSSFSAFYDVLSGARHVERELTRVQTYAATEAGLQVAMAQIAQNGYTGFINTANIGTTAFQTVDGIAVGTFSVNINYPNQADWVTLNAQATVDNETRQLEGRVFLQSNLSKYLMYADTSTIWLGTNLVLGTHDGVNPEGVSANENDRAALYYTDDLVFWGTNIHVYGDTHAEDRISGDATSTIHGDSYVGGFSLDWLGQVDDDGIDGNLVVEDGFVDGPDRNEDGSVDIDDLPDRHDLTDTGEGDAHATETLDTIDLDFYRDNNSNPARNRGYGTGNSQRRYLIFEPTAASDQTRVIVYANQNHFNEDRRQNRVDEFVLPPNAILYNRGDLHVKGEIAGRISVVSSDDIFFDGNVRYSGANSYCSSQNSAAFLARDMIYFRPESLEVSGILYADNEGSGSLAIDSNYNVNGQYRPWDKYNGRLRHYGNLIIDGTANTSNYRTDRAYVYDPNLKYYRPPGLPITPELRTVREV